MPVQLKQTPHQKPKKKTTAKQGKPTQKKTLGIEATTCLGANGAALSDFVSQTRAWLFKQAITAAALAALVFGTVASGNLTW